MYKENDIAENMYIIKSGSFEISTYHTLIEEESAKIYNSKNMPVHLKVQKGN